jgi:hypothetical protein
MNRLYIEAGVNGRFTRIYYAERTKEEIAACTLGVREEGVAVAIAIFKHELWHDKASGDVGG